MFLDVVGTNTKYIINDSSKDQSLEFSMSHCNKLYRSEEISPEMSHDTHYWTYKNPLLYLFCVDSIYVLTLNICR